MATYTTHYNLTKPGRSDAVDVTVLNGDFDIIDGAIYDKQDKVAKGTLTLSSSAWTGNGPYAQVITLEDATAHSKIDLQPDATVIGEMINDGVTALWVENNNGVLTAYAMGAIPSSALVLQYIRTEVDA